MKADPHVLLNGELLRESRAAIPVSDKGFLFGEGVFTTIRVNEGKCELFDAHLQALEYRAQSIGMPAIDPDPDRIRELIEANGAATGTWRLKIIGTGSGNALVTVHPYCTSAEKSVKLCLFPHPCEIPLAGVKSLSYGNSVFMHRYAIARGYDDALTTNAEEAILETSKANVFWIDGDICMIPDPGLPYLQGVFLNALLKCLPIPILPVRLPFSGLPEEALVYTCNSLIHVRSVESIENKRFRRCPRFDAILKEATAIALESDYLSVKERPSESKSCTLQFFSGDDPIASV